MAALEGWVDSGVVVGIGNLCKHREDPSTDARRRWGIKHVPPSLMTGFARALRAAASSSSSAIS